LVELNLKGKKFYLSTFIIFLIFLATINGSSLIIENNSSLYESTSCTNHSQGEDFTVFEDGILYQYVYGNLVLSNLTNPGKPATISQITIDFTSNPTNFYVSDGYAYFVTFDNELYAYDCSDPTNIVKVYDHEFEGCIRDIVVKDGYMYVTQDKNVTIYEAQIYGVVKVGEVSLPCDYFLMFLVVHEGFAYAYNWQDDFSIVNVTDPTNPTYESAWSYDYGRIISHVGDYLFEILPGSGFRVTNISIPGEPTIVAYVSASHALYSEQDMYYFNNQIYLLYSKGLAIYDATDMTNITEVTVFQLPNYENQLFSSFIVVDDYVYISNSRERNHLYVIDVSNPAFPEHIYPFSAGINISDVIFFSAIGLLSAGFLAVIIVNIVRSKKK
jgi:hypothetical protein